MTKLPCAGMRLSVVFILATMPLEVTMKSDSGTTDPAMFRACKACIRRLWWWCWNSIESVLMPHHPLFTALLLKVLNPLVTKRAPKRTISCSYLQVAGIDIALFQCVFQLVFVPELGTTRFSIGWRRALSVKHLTGHANSMTDPPELPLD